MEFWFLFLAILLTDFAAANGKERLPVATESVAQE